MRARILESPIDDLANARAFYDRQGQGLGDYFLDSLQADIDSLVLYAGIHQRVLGYHRLLATRFPYAVYYKLDADDVIVWRVLDLRRDPRRLRRALDQ